MQATGMSIREDAMGNIWAHWAGSDVDAGEYSEANALGLLVCHCYCTAPGNSTGSTAQKKVLGHSPLQRENISTVKCMGCAVKGSVGRCSLRWLP